MNLAILKVALEYVAVALSEEAEDASRGRGRPEVPRVPPSVPPRDAPAARAACKMIPALLRGYHLSNTTCLAYAFFKSGAYCSSIN